MFTRVRVLALLLAAAGSACDVESVSLHPSGTTRARGTRDRRTGLETGEWATYYANGQVRELGRYESGRRVGVWTQWHSNGQRRSEGARAWDEATRSSPGTGTWRHWHADGTIAALGIWFAGEREGAWEFSLADGSLDGDRTGQYHRGIKLDP